MKGKLVALLVLLTGVGFAQVEAAHETKKNNDCCCPSLFGCCDSCGCSDNSCGCCNS